MSCAIDQTNPLVGPLLTDMYQISMAYAHWKNGKHNEYAVFDLFFRKNPFGGEFCIFAGSDEVLRFLQNFQFTVEDCNYLRSIMPNCEAEFFEWLQSLSCKDMKMYAIREGSLVFPREPLIRIEGPLCVGQLLETTLLNLVNYPSLVATNAARMRLAAGPNKSLLEFGLRRAQGPDGALSASKYAYIGGFDGTSNVLAGKLFGIEVKGTHAHAYVMSYTNISQLRKTTIPSKTDPNIEIEFVSLVLKYRVDLNFELTTNEGELAAFASYAQAFPDGFLALVDTYDTIKSGVPNFICVALALRQLGYQAKGVRLDSGDLAYLSRQTRQKFRDVDALLGLNFLTLMNIVASNDINEGVLLSLNREGHEIDTFGIGTHLVTCQSQPALGCVYKLVEINGHARIKLSQEIEKLVIPGKKCAYRLFGKDGNCLLDLIQLDDQPPPAPNVNVLCRHPFQGNKRALVKPESVETLLQLVWSGSEGGIVPGALLPLEDARKNCQTQLNYMRNDHIRMVNPTPYKLSVDAVLFEFIHKLWMDEAPIAYLS